MLLKCGYPLVFVGNMKIKFVSDMFSTSGLSAHARSIVVALHKYLPEGVTLYVEDRKKEPSEADLRKEDLMAISRHMIMDPRKEDVCIFFEPAQFLQPENLDKDVLNIAFTQWETTKIRNYPFENKVRNNWVRQLNFMDGVFSTSKESVRAFISSGVNVPCLTVCGPIYQPRDKESEVLIYGVNYDPDAKELIDRSARKVVVGYVAQMTPRKNIESFVRTIACGLSGRKDVIAVLKTYGSPSFSDSDKIVNHISSFKKSLTGVDSPPIVIISDKLSDEEVENLFNTFDIYFTSSRAEGYNVPAALAASRGLPVISPDWGGHTHFIQDRYQIPGSFKYVSGMKDYDSDQLWYEIDEAKAAARLNQVIDVINSERTHQEDGVDLSSQRKESIASYAFLRAGEEVFVKNLLGHIERLLKQKKNPT